MLFASVYVCTFQPEILQDGAVKRLSVFSGKFNVHSDVFARDN